MQQLNVDGVTPTEEVQRSLRLLMNQADKNRGIELNSLQVKEIAGMLIVLLRSNAQMYEVIMGLQEYVVELEEEYGIIEAETVPGVEEPGVVASFEGYETVLEDSIALSGSGVEEE